MSNYTYIQAYSDIFECKNFSKEALFCATCGKLVTCCRKCQLDRHLQTDSHKDNAQKVLDGSAKTQSDRVAEQENARAQYNGQLCKLTFFAEFFKRKEICIYVTYFLTNVHIDSIFFGVLLHKYVHKLAIIRAY